MNSVRVFMPSPENFHLYSQFRDAEVLFLDQLTLNEPNKLNDLQLPINLKRLIITLTENWKIRKLMNNLFSKNERMKFENFLYSYEEEIKKNIKLPFGCKLKLYVFESTEAFGYWSKHSRSYEKGTVWLCSSDCTQLRTTLE